jgi:hypothetical protein
MLQGFCGDKGLIPLPCWLRAFAARVTFDFSMLSEKRYGCLEKWP